MTTDEAQSTAGARERAISGLVMALPDTARADVEYLVDNLIAAIKLETLSEHARAVARLRETLNANAKGKEDREETEEEKLARISNNPDGRD